MSSPKPRETFELLDFLRGICAICVVAMHTSDQYGLIYSIPHAYIAVPFFFMLSGIVIAHSYEKEVMKKYTVINFMVIRIERLYPLLIMGLIVSLFFAYFRFSFANYDNVILMIGASIFLIPWPGESLFPLLPPQWSLAIEIWGNLVHRLISKWLGLREIALITALGAISMTYFSIHFGGLNIGWSMENGFGGLSIFVFCYPCGILLYRMWDTDHLWKAKMPVSMLILALLAAICIPTPLRTVENGVRDLAFVIIIFPLILSCAIRIKISGLTRKIGNFLGKISYPIYIVHYPLVIFLTSLFIKGHASRILEYISVPAIVMISVVFSSACLSIDIAIRRRLKSIRGNRASTQPAAAP